MPPEREKITGLVRGNDWGNVREKLQKLSFLRFEMAQLFLSKTLRITPVRRQKDNKKEPRTIRNELLWTLLFYSVFALKN